MKKITVILVMAALVYVSIVPIANSASTASISGSFQPQATLSIQCNASEINGTTMNLGEAYHLTNPSGAINVSNDGDVNCSVDIQAINSTGGWSLIDNASCAGGTNVFSVTFDDDGAITYEDLWVPVEISANLGANLAGWDVNSSRFNLTIWLGGNQDQATEYQHFFVNLSAAVVT